MSVLAELDASLEALRALKPPGVTKSRIASITALCLENVKSESVLVQKIFTQFKRTPATHKLGVLYVVDSVTRQWIERAGATGQDIYGSASPDGTFAAGVRRVTELLPVLMQDLIQSAPDDQKDKIIKLLDIWERGNIFPLNMLSDFKTKLNARPSKPITIPQNTESTTPVSVQDTTNQLPVSQQNASSALAGLSRLNGNSGAPTLPTSFTSNGVSNSFGHQQHTSHVPTQPGLGSLLPAAPQTTAQPSITAAQASALASVIPAHIASNPEALAHHLKLLQQLAEMGVPPDQWTVVVQALQEQQAAAQRAVATLPAPLPTPLPVPLSAPLPVATAPGNTPRARSRSPAHRRDSPVYGKYDNVSNYRQRSPLRSGSASLQDDKIMLTNPRWTDFDTSLPEGQIKVLSRTLFAGGVACSEDELRRIFSRFGQVQTCIVNHEKRHAFVKMCTRAEAIAAKAGMENIQDQHVLSKIRSTRWGVGFGPRDCSDYQTGISIIPIDRLTDADRKWVLSAEYGGTGGKPIATGLVMEEPDIEIGAGVSSKAISARRPEPRRGGGGSGGVGGGRSTDNSPASRFNRRPDRQLPTEVFRQVPVTNQPQQYDLSGVGVPPAVPGFGFQIPGMTSFGTGPRGSQP